jgi:hypothetical protein
MDRPDIDEMARTLLAEIRLRLNEAARIAKAAAACAVAGSVNESDRFDGHRAADVRSPTTA